MELRLLYFSAEDDEYIVVTDELEVDPRDCALSGYGLACDLRFTPNVRLGSIAVLPLGREMHVRD